MKEELQGKLVEILTSIQTAAGKASDLAMEQLPDIAQSYVMYGRASMTFWLVLGVAIAAASVWVLCTILPKAIDDDNPGIGLPAGFGGFAGSIIGVLTVITNLNGFLLVWFAPKVWLLKEIASFLK